MKKILTFIFLLSSVFSTAFANETFTLKQSIELKRFYRGVLEHVAVLPPGTRVSVDSYSKLSRGTQYEDVTRRIFRSRGEWVELVDFRLNFRPMRGTDLDYAQMDLERGSRRDRFYISETFYQFSDYFAPPRPAPVYTPRPTYTNTGYNSYEVCYVQPRTQWVTVRDEQARAGRRNTAIGIGATVAGILLGNSSDRGTRNLGTVLTVGGAALATVGLVQISSAKDPITTYNDECRQYYTRDTQVRYVTIENQRCTTERYYSRSWDREVEYFQTTCSSQRYYSFERNSQFWY